MFKLGDARKKHTRRAFAPLAAAVMVMLAATTVFATPTIAKANPFADAWNGIVSFFAGDAGIEPAAAGDVSVAQADSGTQLNYQSALGGQNSTVATGRVWTDKSVFTGDLTFSGDIENGNGDKSDTTKLAEGEKFLVSYSALVATEKISGKANVPVDVVFVIDNSNSMDSSVGGNSRQSRLQATVDAVNASIKTVMDSNPDSRIAVVLYGNSAQTLLPLGHYEPMSNGNFISVENWTEEGGWLEDDQEGNEFTASDGHSVRMNDQVRGTNIHMGIDSGMDVLANAQQTTTTVNGKDITHMPALILLSDGAASAAGGGNWWNPSGNDGDGTSNSNKYVMKAIMNASYMKKQVDAHYGLSNQSQYQTKVYTVGMGIEQLRETGWGADNTSYYQAQMALDPRAHLTDKNDVARVISQAWSSYAQGNRPTIDGYRFFHPTSGDIDSIAYNDGYYAAENAEDVSKVFDDITSSITTSVPQIPTDYDNAYNPNDDGALTYTDPIGQYMEVKDIKKLIYAGKVYTLKDGEQYTGPGTYHFEGTVTSPVDGQDKDLGLIELTVSEADGKQTLTVKIPAGLIPLRVNEVTLGTNDQVESHDVSGQYPMRLVYSVGFDPDVLQNDGTVDFTKIDSEYAKNHRDEATGNVWFYSNEYTTNEESCGDATVSFKPATTNPFYFVQQDVPLYTSENGEAATGEWDPKATYWYPVTYYEGNEVKTIWRDRLGSALAQEEGGQLEGVKQAADGKWYIAAGTPRLVNLSEYGQEKNPNTTQTATSSYHVEFVGGTVAEGHFEVHLGNNGRVGAEEPGILTVSKTATVAAGFTGPVDADGKSTLNDQQFTFTLTLSDNAEHRAQVFKGTEKVGNEFTVKNGDTFTLKNGETLYVYNITKGTTYAVEETAMPNGFTQLTDKTENDSGTIAAGVTSAAKFANEYKAAEGTAKADVFQFQKNFASWDNNPGISFEFWLVDGGNTAGGLASNPFPEGTEVKQSDDGQRYISKTVRNGDMTNFGDIKFTLPGTYTYSIHENTPLDADKVLGVDYSQEAYAVVVTVEDKGSGNLEVTSVMTKTVGKGGEQISEPATTAVVTNTYTLDNVHMQPVGTKVYTNNTGDSSLKGGEFTFHVKAITAGAPELLDGTGDDAKPLPNTDGVYEFKNAVGGSIAFGNIRFTKDNANKIYVYEIWEDVPAGAENGPVDGMTYDTNHYFAHVKAVPATVDGKDGLKTEVTFRKGADETSEVVNFEGNRVLFRNSYTADPVVLGDDANAAIAGQKTLNGRDWLEGEEFSFKLVPTDNVNDVAYVTGDKSVSTKEALESGVVKFGDAANATEATATATVANVAGSKGTPVSFDFGKMTFAHEGTYTFEVTETPGNADGVTYDKTAYTVTVKVTDDGKGQLKAAVSYNDGAATNAAFTNTYSSSFSYRTVGGLDVVKNLTGRNLLADSEFQFTIKGEEGTSHAVDTTVQTDRHTDRGTCTMNALSNLNFTQEDAGKTFVYEVDEVDAKLPQVTYDLTVYTVEIEVIDNNDGTMHTVTTVKKGSAEVATFDSSQNQKASVAFNNTYEPKSITVDTSTGLGFTFAKNLTGRDWNDGETFSFTMKPSDKTPNAPMPKDAVNGAVTVPVNKDAASRFDFGSIEFTQGDMDGAEVAANGTKSKTFTYTVKEDAPADADGMTYDRTDRTLTITVTDDGKGQLSAKASLNGSSTFTNKYGVEEGARATVAPTVEKWVEGRDSNADFSFTMKLIGGDAENVEGLTEDGTVKATVKSGIAEGNYGTADFSEVSFTKDGDYTFEITEDTPAAGWTDSSNDEQKATHTVTFKVSDNGKGGYGVIPDAHKAEFANSYEATAEGDTLATVKATKTLTGRTLHANDFDFGILYRSKYDPVKEAPTGDVITQAKNTDTENDNVKFELPAYTASELNKLAGNNDSKNDVTYETNEKGNRVWTIKYTAFEMTAGLANKGIEVTKASFDFEVVVTDQGDGKLSAEVVYAEDDADNAPTFTNVYNTATATCGISATKTLTGRDMKAGDFEFAVKTKPIDTDKGTATEVLSGKSVDTRAGEVSEVNFAKDGGQPAAGQLSYTLAELEAATQGNNKYATVEDGGSGARTWTLHYTIAENTVGLADKGITPKGAISYDFVIKVTDDGKGTLTATGPYVGDSSTEQSTPFAFTNEYGPKENTDLTAETNGLFTKKINGRNWKEGDAFTFSMKAADSQDYAPMPAASEDGKTASTTVSYDDLKQGTQEAVFGFGDITFDFSKITNWVEGQNGTRTATFTYEVTENDLLKEQTASGLTKDDHTATLTITVTDNGDGSFETSAVVAQTENPVFTNNYDTEVVYSTVGPQIKKTLTGRNMTKDQFAFTVAAEDGSDLSKLGISTESGHYKTPSADSATEAVVNLIEAKNGVTFTKDNDNETYSFKVEEVKENKDGYQYDKSVYHVTIAVAYDDQAGVLTVTTTVKKDGSDNVQTKVVSSNERNDGAAVLEFNNSYTATGSIPATGDAAIQATKELTGRPLKDKEFNFQVKSGDKVVATGTNDAQGKITFSEIKFSNATVTDQADTLLLKDAKKSGDTYEFQLTVSEVTDGLAGTGVTATTTSPFAITVNVVDNGNGTLTPTIVYPQGSNSLTFKNSYQTDVAPVVLGGVKTLALVSDKLSVSQADIAGKYSFTLEGVDGAPMPEGAQDNKVVVTNDAAGNFTFGTINYQQPQDMENGDVDQNGMRTKTYEYKVTEASAPGYAHVQNDPVSTKTIKVKLTENTNTGTLVAEVVEGGSQTVGSVTFMNTYSVDPVESSITDAGNLKVTKTISGRPLVDGEFQFAMYEGTSTEPAATGTNDASGNVGFTKITFTEPGEHDYTIRELPGGKNNGVTYDPKTVAAHASVKDNKDGSLSVAWTFKTADGAQASTEVTFENEYAPVSTGGVTIGAAKLLDGRELKASEFEFQLKDEKGKVVDSTKNKADKTVVFKTMDFASLDQLEKDVEAGKATKSTDGGAPVYTYVYTLSEVNGGAENVTYDKTVYDVFVTVKDDLQGHLVSSWSVKPQGSDEWLTQAPVFKNTYTKPADPTPAPEPEPTPEPEPAPAPEPEEPKVPELPKTGDDSMLPIAAAVVTGAACIGGGLVLARRRK